MSTEGGHEPGDVFVVDDNAANLRLLTEILRLAGHHVRTAKTGRRALQGIFRKPPDLVLLDVNMPEMNGYEVCEALRADARTRAVPVIFLSAQSDVLDKVRGFEAGGVDYVTKPFHAAEVLARVRGSIALARMRTALQDQNAALARRNAELEAAHRREDSTFAALSHVLPGTTLDGRYRLGEKIGSGGFAAVFRGTHLASGRAVAIKVLRPPATGDALGQRLRLATEGASAVRLDHPGAVVVLDSGTTPGGIAYLVMELLEGVTLHEELRSRGPLPLARALAILTVVCDVLVEAHGRGVLHRDIKPANIFLHRTGVKVVDFGIAKLEGALPPSSETTVGRLLGTPVYMAPERLLGRPYDGGADVYAVAVTLYEVLVGRVPFEVTDGAIGSLIVACVRDEPAPLTPLRPDVPPSLERTILRGMHKEPLERPTMAAFARALRDASGDAGATAAVTRDEPAA